MRRHGFAACLVGLVLGSPAFAYSVAAPQRQDVFSPNKKFVLDVDPETKVNTVSAANDRSQPLWSFPGKIGFGKALVSNDGQVVAVVEWHFVKEEDTREAGVAFRNAQGVFRNYTVAELCPNSPRTQDTGPGPVGEFWRTWYEDVRNDGERFRLYTTSDVDYEFRFADGMITEKGHFPRNTLWQVIRQNAVVIGLGVLALLVTIMLGVGYWRRRREQRRATTGTDTRE